MINVEVCFIKYNLLFWRSLDPDLMLLSVVTISKTPGGTISSTGAEDCRDTIGEYVAIIAKEFVVSVFTPIVPGTPLDAVETQFTVTSRRAFPTPRTSMRTYPIRSDEGLWVILKKYWPYLNSRFILRKGNLHCLSKFHEMSLRL